MLDSTRRIPYLTGCVAVDGGVLDWGTRSIMQYGTQIAGTS